MANLQKAAKGLKNIRKGYDALLKASGGKRPTTYAKLRVFTESLIALVEEETVRGGFGSTQQPRIKGLTIEAPELEKGVETASGIGEDFGGEKILPLATPKKTKAEVERDKRKAGVKPVFVPKAKEPNPDEEDLKARREAAAKKAADEAAKEAKEIEVAAAAKLVEDQKAGVESRGVMIRDDEPESKDTKEPKKGDKNTKKK